MSQIEHGGSWSIAPRMGAFATVPAWSSASRWLDALMDALATPEGEERRRAVKVAPGTLLRVAYADSLSADVATGRGVSTAHETVAEALGMSKRHVQRCRELMELMGFAVTIETGRYLTRSERAAAQRAHGGRQIRAASVRALTLPKPLAVENVHLPLPQRGLSISPVLKTSPKRASTREVAAPRLQQGSKRTRNAVSRSPRPIEVQQLAAGLVKLLPWLAREHHIGKVCDLLIRSKIDPTRWTALAVKAEVDRFCHSAGVQVVDPGQQRDPLAYFAWMLRMAIDVETETSFERQRREQAEAIERRRQWAVDVAAERARAATLTGEEFRRIRAESDQQIAALRAARRAHR